MFKFIYFAASSFIALTTLACMNMTPAGCDKVKNGRFYYFIKDSRARVHVERTDSLQVETNMQTRHSSRSKIAWTGDCKFDMYINAFSNTKLAGFDSLIAALPVPVEIVKIERDFYISHAVFGMSEQKIESIDTIYFDRRK